MWNFFWKYNVKHRPSVFYNKINKNIKIKNTGMPEKEHRWPKRRMITEDPEEDPINEDPIRTLSLRTLKRGLSLKNLKRTVSLWILKKTPSMRSLRSFRTINDSQSTPFGFLVMVCYRVGDGDKFLYENVGLKRPCFYATSPLKMEVNSQVNSWIPF